VSLTSTTPWAILRLATLSARLQIQDGVTLGTAAMPGLLDEAGGQVLDEAGNPILDESGG
jgi:hypothetical protein